MYKRQFWLSIIVLVPTLVAADDFQSTFSTFANTHCVDCHNADEPSGGLDLEALLADSEHWESPTLNLTSWELVHRRIASRQMPPPDAARPEESEYVDATLVLEQQLQQRSEAFPQIARTESMRRLTRTEYQNAVRDLLGVVIDATEMLPPDESSAGFDNITVGELSPALMSRYISAAQGIARTATGRRSIAPEGITVRVPADRTQESHQPGLPLGTRGGTALTHTFAVSGEYEIELKLTRDRDEKVEGLTEENHLDVLVDGKRLHRFTVKPPPRRNDYTHVDSHLRQRIWIDAGTREIAVTFPQKAFSLIESGRQPFDARYNRHRHPRTTPALFQISLVGPIDLPNDQSETSDPNETIAQERDAGGGILKDAGGVDPRALIRNYARRAYRRTVTDEDLKSPMFFYDQGFQEGGSVAGIEAALTSILVNPHFLFRVEASPADTQASQPHRINDFELASRLSFFLWSSLPDERLLDLAEQQKLHEADVLATEVTRMLLDDRSRSLTKNFASQWLYLRNLDSITPDLRRFPDFDDNLRQAMRGETEHLFDEIVRGNRSVLDLIESDFTFLNERLATHYGITGVLGSHFRRVDLPDDSIRGGILRHASILTVTSYATRTSPTIRGHWILKNILGTPTPPPPDNVPPLAEKTTLVAKGVRERLVQHRENPACASCHNLMDPMGFSLENFDAVGRYRLHEETLAIDSAGMMPDGTEIDGVRSLEQAILKRPELFVTNVVEKLMTFGLGRVIDPADGPAVRRIVAQSRDQDFRFESIVQAIVASRPFLQRIAQ